MSDILSEAEFSYRSPEEELALVRAWKTASPLDWGGMLLRRGMPLLRRNQTDVPDTFPGIYALCMSDGGIVYVGKASDLNARLNQHAQASLYGRAEWFDAFIFQHVPTYALRDVEVAHIHAMAPERNRLYEPIRWSGHGAMVTALRYMWGVE